MIKPTIQLEVASKANWPAVLAVTQTAYSEYAERSDKAFWSIYEKSIENTVLNDETLLRVVAMADSKILGSVLYCPPYEKRMGSAFVTNPFPEMRLLAVPPEHRNQGIAGRLIDDCEERARSSGFPTITLHTTELMQTAKEMYERRGYIRYPDLDFKPVPTFIVWGYRKELDLPAKN